MASLLKNTLAIVASVGFTCIGLLLAGCSESLRKGYRIENGEVVLYRGFPASRTVISEADAKSFTSINTEYGKDNTHVFYIGDIIPKADPATFIYLASAYAKDKNYGYSRDQLISSDGAHFVLVPNPNETSANVTSEGIPYAHDSHHVYKDVMPIDGADPATFVFVPMFNGQYLTHDRRRVYFQDKPLEGADGATFRKVSDYHFADSRGAWGLILGREVSWQRIADVDLASFTGVGKNYAKDKQHVYYSNQIVAGADPATFKETDNLQGIDKQGKYSSGSSVKAKK